MSTSNKSKLNQLLAQWPDGRILTTVWLKKHGYEPELIQKYKNSHWLQPLGVGAFKKFDDVVNWSSAVECVQTQLNLQLHVGGKTALGLLGKTQYLILNQSEILLYGTKKDALPKWIKNYVWGPRFIYKVKALFPAEQDFGSKNFGFTKYEYDNRTIIISAPERAYLEYLDELPQKYSYREALDILENLTSLRSTVVQVLLENCKSLKVKRLFLHLAERVNHPWFKKLEISKLDLGSGKRMIFRNGVLDKKYNITVPKNDSYESI
jgi:hypothetical protein